MPFVCALEEEIGVGRCLLSPAAGVFSCFAFPTSTINSNPSPTPPLVVNVPRGVGIGVFVFGVGCWEGLVTVGWSFVFFFLNFWFGVGVLVSKVAHGDGQRFYADGSCILTSDGLLQHTINQKSGKFWWFVCAGKNK